MNSAKYLHFSSISNQLQSLNYVEHFERLELGLYSDLFMNEFELTSLKCFAGLHLRHYNCLYNLQDHIDTINLFYNLRVLHID